MRLLSKGYLSVLVNYTYSSTMLLFTLNYKLYCCSASFSVLSVLIIHPVPDRYKKFLITYVVSHELKHKLMIIMFGVSIWVFKRSNPTQLQPFEYWNSEVSLQELHEDLLDHR